MEWKNRYMDECTTCSLNRADLVFFWLHCFTPAHKLVEAPRSSSSHFWRELLWVCGLLPPSPISNSCTVLTSIAALTELSWERYYQDTHVLIMPVKATDRIILRCLFLAYWTKRHAPLSSLWPSDGLALYILKPSDPYFQGISKSVAYIF